jgi:hypothetical protein
MPVANEVKEEIWLRSESCHSIVVWFGTSITDYTILDVATIGFCPSGKILTPWRYLVTKK